VTVSIFGFAVGFLIKTAAYGRFQFLWFQEDSGMVPALHRTIKGLSYTGGAGRGKRL